MGIFSALKWLTVSRSEGKADAWCSESVLFSFSSEYLGQQMGKVVSRPLTDFSDLTGKNVPWMCTKNLVSIQPTQQGLRNSLDE